MQLKERPREGGQRANFRNSLNRRWPTEENVEVWDMVENSVFEVSSYWDLFLIRLLLPLLS